MATARLIQPDGAITTEVTLGGTVAVGQFVRNSAGSVVVTAADTQVSFGLAMGSGVSGEKIAILVSGLIEMEASSALSIGSDIAWQTNHEAQTATTGEVILGQAVSAAAADGDAVIVNFQPSSRTA